MYFTINYGKNQVHPPFFLFFRAWFAEKYLYLREISNQ